MTLLLGFLGVLMFSFCKIFFRFSLLLLVWRVFDKDCGSD